MILSKHRKAVLTRIGCFVIPIAVILFPCHFTSAQQPDVALERRVTALESYVSTFQPTLVEMSNNLNESIQQYTRDLESSLASYSTALQTGLDQRLNSLGNKTVLLNPFSKETQSIQTNTGTFLIAVEQVEQSENGVRLHVNIGNPNYADYNGFKLRFIWGKKRVGEYGASYEEWQQSLKGVEVMFQGKLEKGKWNSLVVDLSPVGQGELSYLECEMNVTSVELGAGNN